MDIKSKSAELTGGGLPEALTVYKEEYNALGLDHRDSLLTLRKIASILKVKKAFETHADILIKRFQMLGIEHRDELQRCFYLAEILKKAVNAEKATEINQSLEKMLLSWIEEIRGKYDKRKLDEALSIGNEICEDMCNLLGRANPITLKMKNLIGYVYCEMQKYDAALSIYDEVYEERLKLFGEDNRKTLNSLMNKAYVLLQKCEFENAWNTYEKVYKKRKIILGPFHEKTLRSLKSFFHIHSKLGAYNEAIEGFMAIYHMQRIKGYKREKLNTAKDVANLYFKQSKYEEALEIWTNVYIVESQWDSKHPHTLLTRSNIAKVLAEEGNYEEAMLIYNEILQLQKSSDIPENSMHTVNNIAMIFRKQKDYNSAREILSKLNTESCRILGPEHSTTLSIQSNMGALLCSQGCFDQAVTIYNTVRDARERSLGLYHADTLKATCSIARVYVHQEKYDEALRVYNEARELMYAILLPGHKLDCLSIDTEIAEVYIKQRRYNKAFQMYYDLYERKADIYGVDHRYTSEIKERMRHIAAGEQGLIKATKEADLDMAKSCLENGDDINVRDSRGYTPLHIVSEKGYADMLKLLLKNGAIYEVKNMEGKTPTDIASNDEVKNILHLAYLLFSLVEENDCEQMIEILEEEKTIINARDKYGCTALHWASYMGYVNIVRLLLDVGVNYKAVSKEGETALHHAAFGCHSGIIEILLDHVREYGADEFHEFLNAKTTSTGMTALHLVAHKNNLLAFKLLLEYGANASVMDKLKRSPFDVTEDSGIQKLLAR